MLGEVIHLQLLRGPPFSSFFHHSAPARIPASTSRLVDCNEARLRNGPYAENSTFETNHIQGGI